MLLAELTSRWSHATGGRQAVSTVRQMIGRVPIEISPLDDVVAATAAALRAHHRSLKLSDALVIATAIVLDADRLVTTDRRWPPRRRLGLRAAIIKL